VGVSPRQLKHFFSGSLFYDAFSVTRLYSKSKKSKAVPLHAMEALGGRGGIAPTHSRPRL
jgi:hypothetical protein